MNIQELKTISKESLAKKRLKQLENAHKIFNLIIDNVKKKALLGETCYTFNTYDHGTNIDSNYDSITIYNKELKEWLYKYGFRKVFIKIDRCSCTIVVDWSPTRYERIKGWFKRWIIK